MFVSYLRDVDLFDKELLRKQRAEAKAASAASLPSDRRTRGHKRKSGDGATEEDATSEQQQQRKRSRTTDQRDADDDDEGAVDDERVDSEQESGDDEDDKQPVDAAAAAAASPSMPSTPGTPGGASSSRRYANVYKAGKAGNHAGFADLAALVSNSMISLLVCMPLLMRQAFKGACTPYIYVKSLLVITLFLPTCALSLLSAAFTLLVFPTHGCGFVFSCGVACVVLCGVG